MAITLGLVEAIDSNGVYVTMPGSRGVLRGPYRSLSTVAAGTTVLVASTDDGEQVVVGPAPGGDGTVNVLSFGAVGDGVTDDTAAVQSAMTAGVGKVVLFPAGYTFVLSSAVTVSSQTSVFGYGATVKGVTKHVPCFDIVQGEDITVRGLKFLTTITRTYTGGTTQRGADIATMWCGIYVSGSRITIRDCSFSGFTSGLTVTKWDGADMTGDADHILVQNCQVDTVDFGVLCDATDNLTVHGLSGSYVGQSGWGAPPHLFYASGGAALRTSTNLTVTDVRGFDSPDGHCVQIKDTVGAVVSQITTDGCDEGLLSLDNSTQVSISTLSYRSAEMPAACVYLQAGCEDVSLSDISIIAGTAASGKRAGRIAGSRITASGLRVQTTWEVDAQWEWYVLGDDITISGVWSQSLGSYSPYVFGIDGTNEGASTNIHVSNVTAPNCYSSGCVRIFGDVTGSIELDSDRVAALVNASGLTNTVRITTFGDVLTHPGTYVGFFGTAPITKPTVTGSRGGNAALASLLTELANLGLITDSSS